MEINKNLVLKVETLMQAQELNKEKYNAYSKRASLILFLYPEIQKLNFKEIPKYVLEELKYVSLLSILLQPMVAMNKIDMGEIGYTEDGCIIKKEKVEEYNQYLQKYLYLVILNSRFGYITMSEDINYNWRVLSERDINKFKISIEEAKNKKEIKELIYQIELLRHGQPLDISLKLAEIRDAACEKCNLNLMSTSTSNSYEAGLKLLTDNQYDFNHLKVANYFSKVDSYIEGVKQGVNNFVDKISEKDTKLTRSIIKIKKALK